MQSLADVLAPALVGRDDPPPDPGGAGLDRLLESRYRRVWHWPRTALVALLAIFALVGATYIVALPLLQPLWSADRAVSHARIR